MIGVLSLLRLYIFAASHAGVFRRWMGIPLLAIHVAYVVLQYLVSAA